MESENEIEEGEDMADDKSYHSTEYKRWKRMVLFRDNYECAVTGAKSPLEVHHIKTWKDCPALRFDVDNGITLERSFHRDVVTKHEKGFEKKFEAIVKQKKAAAEGRPTGLGVQSVKKEKTKGKWKRSNPRIRF